jgi:ADP-ribose pyrophosphatase YjhB (NUDIX family)
MKFCSQCGKPVTQRTPEGDNRPRHICDHCETIHYHNPKIVAGCLPVWQDKVLLCKRAIEPRYGLWTLPAGFMENNETLEQAAERESREEANTNLSIENLYTVISLPHINQVYMVFRAQLNDLNFSPGTESLEVALFDEAHIPWDQLAFGTIQMTLRLFFEDRQQGTFPLHTCSIDNRNQPE